MVYCGKPSKGCEACRKKKIRCDQVPNGCTNCLRSKKACPGYRNQIDLMFRDESKHVIRKAQAKSEAAYEANQQLRSPDSQSMTLSFLVDSKSAKPSFSPDFESTSYDAGLLSTNTFAPVRRGEALFLPPIACSYSFLPSFDEVGETFFFNHYVLDNGSIMDSSGPLLASMKAVGIAGTSTQAQDPSLMAEARKQYSTAIKQVNAALQSPRDVKKDSTLLAIYILGIFETTSGCVKRSVDDWATHVNGSATLLKIRGPQQLRTYDGIRLFMQVGLNIINSCLRLGIDLPNHIHELNAQVSEIVNTDEPGYKMYITSAQATAFRAHVRQGQISDPQEIIAKALEFDQTFAAILELATGPQWGYQTVHTSQYPEVVFDGQYHIYVSYVDAQLWNGIRCHRIMLYEMVQQALLRQSPVDASFVARHTAMTTNMHALQRDILASIPQHMGLIDNKTGTILNPDTIQPSSLTKPRFPWSAFDDFVYDLSGGAVKPKNTGLPLLRQFGGYGVLWPVFLAGTMDDSTTQVRLWIINILRLLGTSQGTQQAFTMANEVERLCRVQGAQPC